MNESHDLACVCLLCHLNRGWPCHRGGGGYMDMEKPGKKNELKGKRMTDFTETRGSCIIMLTLLSKVLKPGVPKMGCLHSKSGVP